jgi:hypothetical protein
MESLDQRMAFVRQGAPLGKKGSASGERWETGVDGAGPADEGGGSSASPRDLPSVPPAVPHLGSSLAGRCWAGRPACGSGVDRIRRWWPWGAGVRLGRWRRGSCSRTCLGTATEGGKD